MSATDKAQLCAVAAVTSVISNVRYYDTADRTLRRGDIEIRDGEIVRIARPGSLGADDRVDGSAFVCLPGLVNAGLPADVVRDEGATSATTADYNERVATVLYDLLLQAVSNGVTTIGMFGTRIKESLAAAIRTGVRVSLYRAYTDLWLGPEPGPAVWDTAACLRDYEQSARRFDGTRFALHPAVGSQLAASTHLLTGLHDFARRHRRRFVVRVDGGIPWADSFRDAYGCTGLGLLHSLDVLDENVLVVPVTPMSFGDRERLRHSASHVVWPARELAGSPAQRGDVARAGITRQMQAALAWDQDALPCLVASDDHARDERAGEIIDLLTWKGAQALTFSETGRIAVGQRADLLLYDGHVLADDGRSATACMAVLDAICRYRPRGVLVDGRWAIAGVFQDRGRLSPAGRLALTPRHPRDTMHASPRPAP
ncbi:amidohydrolase family protein [Burkholderia sp. BCC0419]|uniref:amidohydrolase family protein n=1 Tax=Burkholderia sp. BCC0419 TaxID=486878 RepID=UPI00158D3570|nr:amidohydrolase family protein [Burkholderia sp. BCC0419]